MYALLLALLAPAATPDDVAAAVARSSSWRSQRQAAHVPVIPADSYRRAAAGEVVTGLEAAPSGNGKVAWGVVFVRAPVGQVWSAVNDFSSRTDFSKVAFSQVQVGQHCASGRQVFQLLPVGFPISDRWWISTLVINQPLWQASKGAMRELAFRASTDPAGLKTDEARTRAAAATPVGRSEGAWLVLDVGGGTSLVEYHAASEPGGSVPQSFANAFATSGVKGTLEAVVKLVAADPRCPQG